jgi:hypothetical protein
MPAPSSHSAAHWLRSKGWSIDCGMWIFKGDKSCGFTLEAAIARQKGHDLTASEKAKAEAVMASIG